LRRIQTRLSLAAAPLDSEKRNVDSVGNSRYTCDNERHAAAVRAVEDYVTDYIIRKEEAQKREQSKQERGHERQSLPESQRDPEQRDDSTFASDSGGASSLSAARFTIPEAAPPDHRSNSNTDTGDEHAPGRLPTPALASALGQAGRDGDGQ
jgi:hypothetical protein